MNTIDIDLKVRQITINDIIKAITDNRIKYDNSVDSDCRLIELLVLHIPLFPIVVRYNESLNISITDNFSALGYDIYNGHGLIKTIKDYIINNIPITNFSILTELNGKSFSELPLYYQRRIKESVINVYIDNSYFVKNDTKFIQYYNRVLESMN